MKPVVILGIGTTANLAHFFLTHDSPYRVVAFTVDRSHSDATELHGLPVVPLDEVLVRYPTDRFSMFVAVGYGRVNKFREEKYLEAKAMGYELISYVSSSSTIWPGSEIGDNCFLMERNVIQPFTRIGNNVLMWSGCQVGHDSIIGDHVFLGAHAVVAGRVTIEPNCFIGINATIRDRVTVARETVIGAGALIMKDTQPRQVYVGQSAQLLAMTSNRLVSF